jgi:Transposase DDE domain group 1
MIRFGKKLQNQPFQLSTAAAVGCLLRDIEELLTRPVGRPSHKPIVWYKGFLYQAASWKTARRVVAKVEFHTGELFPRIGFIVTNLETPSRAVVRLYNKRGTAEQWIKEGKQAVKMYLIDEVPPNAERKLAFSLVKIPSRTREPN